jgi:sugar/nucleoside kinase (ribokinase family)
VGDIVLGLGGTVDYEIRWDTGVLESLVREYDIHRDELSSTITITDERALVVVVLAFLEAGAGGERFVESSAIVEQFAARFPTAVTLGGTGVRAGIVLDRLGIPSVQHLVSIDDNVRRLLPTSTRYISSATRDTLDPHLIVQYAAGTRVRIGDDELVAPHPNRVIFANDPPNREMVLSDELPATLERADVFLISGFNTMTDVDTLGRRLDVLVDALRSLSADALVFYEEAGFYHRDFAKIARDRLLPWIDVYSMNEDELQETLGREVDLLDRSSVSAALKDAHSTVPGAVLVVHTKYWAIAVGSDASRYREALESAVRMSATRYRLGDGLTSADFAATAALPSHPGGMAVVTQVERDLPAAGVAAHLIEAEKPTTIGLGDSFVGGFLAAVPRGMPAA